MAASSRPLAGQGVGELAAACEASHPLSSGLCVEAAVATRAALGHVGLMAGMGSEVPGSAGTLGRRLASSPRVALGVRVGFASAAQPDAADPGDGPARRSTFLAGTLDGSITVGAFDGFQLLPTIGGVLSLDVVGRASAVFLPRGEGYDGGVGAFTLGARLGLLRESFTVPGVAVSVSQRLLGDIRLGSVDRGDRWGITIDPAVTSVRATVGKDFLAVGFLAGWGWDRYTGDVRLSLADGGGGQVTLDSFEATRTLLFGGASMNFLILQVSLEGGWARGFGAVPAYRAAPFDAAGGTFFAGAAMRLTI